MSGERMYAEARRVLDDADAAGLALRLIGGLAVYARAGEAARRELGRDYGDLDLVAHRDQSRAVRARLEQLGYRPDAPFNAAHGAERLMYFAADDSFHVDVFLDRFRMSHTLDFTDRLELEALTLPAADLLLTKLQIAELNLKDAQDTAMLLLDHAPGDADGPGRIGLPRLVEVAQRDWGFYTTLTDNMAGVRQLLADIVHDEEPRALIASRLDEIEQALEAAPKSRAWRLRAKVGRRMRWYDLPDESIED